MATAELSQYDAFRIGRIYFYFFHFTIYKYSVDLEQCIFELHNSMTRNGGHGLPFHGKIAVGATKTDLPACTSRRARRKICREDEQHFVQQQEQTPRSTR